MSTRFKKRFLVFGLLFGFLLFGFFTCFGDKGLLHLLRLKRELAKVKEMNLRLLEENERLKEEIRRLRNDKRYIEEVARKELGLVKEGELIYQFDLPEEKSP